MDHNAMGMDPCDNQNDAIFNITTDKRTHVDARTGLFEAHVPLPSVTGNVGCGPVVDLSLYYSPVVNNHAALGDGWSFAFTTWYEKNSDLTLHTGEALRVEKGKDLITPAVMITWSDGGNTMTVERKDGRVETLKKPEAGRVWVPARLTTDGYRYLDFTWATVAQTVGKATHHQVRLTGIRDPDRPLLDVSYGPDEKSPATVMLTFWPGTNETLQFVLDIKDVALQSVTAPEGTKTTFDYLEHATCGWLLRAVETFEGLKEDVEYADNGLKFKDNPKLSALPAVNTHTVTPKAGGEKVVETYKYFWDADASRRDFGFGVRGGHQTEISNTNRVTAYLYTSQHEMTVEATVQGPHEKVKYFLSDTDWVDGTIINSRLMQTRYDGTTREFSIDSVTKDGLTLKMDAGTTSRFTYESAAKGSSSAESFRHFYLASERSGATPSPIAGNTPFSTDKDWSDNPLNIMNRMTQANELARGMSTTLKKTYAHVTVAGLNRKKISSLSVAKKRYNLIPARLRQEIDYFESNDFRKGRQRSVRQGNVSDAGTLIDSTVRRVIFDYTTDDSRTALTMTTTEAMADVSRTSVETRSILSGRLIKQIDTDGNETVYTYDAYGRLSSQTACAQSDIYRQTTTYTYPCSNRVEMMEPNGQKRAVNSDGLDNTVVEQAWEQTAKVWRDTRSVAYDVLGRKKSSSEYDYLADGTQLVVSCEFSYDDWGNECCQSFNDGRTLFNQYDPIQQVREEWTGSATEKRRKRTTYCIDDTVEKIEWLDIDGNVYRTENYTFTDTGEVSSRSDNATRVFYRYDSAGRTISEHHHSDGKSCAFSYEYPESWLSNQPRKIGIEFDGKTRTLGERNFDSWGRVTSMTRGGITEAYSYKGTSTAPESKSTADGKTITYQHIMELGNRVSKISSEDRSQIKSFTYTHGVDRTSTASEGDTLLVFDHDLHQRVNEARAQVHKSPEKTVRRTWTPAGRLLGETDANGKAIAYEYDATGRRTRTIAGDTVTMHGYDNQSRPIKDTVKLAADEVTVSYAYNASGREQQRRFKLANGFDLTVERRYYPDGRLQSTELKDGDDCKAKKTYIYTSSGRLETCQTTGVWRPRNPKGKMIDKQVFSHDWLDNLTQCATTFEGEICVSRYRYDEATGSRLEKVEHDHPDYRPSATLEYDANGRMTRDSSGKTYSYDWLGRLVQAGSRYYTYDAMDRIATTVASDQEQQVVYDGMQVRGEYGADGCGRHLEPGSSACTVQRVKRSGVERTLFELRDVNGTVLVTYDATAKTMKHHAYAAYGAHTSEETDSLLGFNGEYRDSNNDQYPLGQGYRSYDPVSMCFHAPDDWSPFGRGGPNIYGYGNGDPVNWQDPSGHMAVGSGAVNRGLRAVWGSRLPGPVGLGSSGSLISAIIWGGIGVMAAIMTGGASLLLTAALVGLAIASAATAIASVIVADTNPQLAAILGWVSFGTGIVGGAATLGRKVAEVAAKLGRTGLAAARTIYARGAGIIRQQLTRLRAARGMTAGATRTGSRIASVVDDALGSLSPSMRSVGSIVDDALGSLRYETNQSSLARLWDKYMQAFDLDDAIFVGGAATGALGNAGAADSEDGAVANAWINVHAMVPWTQLR